HKDLRELWIGPQVCRERGLLQTSREVARRVLAQIRGRGCSIRKSRSENSLIDQRYPHRAWTRVSVGECSISAATAAEIDIGLHCKKGRQNRFCIDLIGIP